MRCVHVSCSSSKRHQAANMLTQSQSSSHSRLCLQGDKAGQVTGTKEAQRLACFLFYNVVQDSNGCAAGSAWPG